MFHFLVKNPAAELRGIKIQNSISLVPVFQNLYHMVFEIVSYMICSSYCAHGQLLSFFIAFRDPVFIRPAELSGIQQRFL
jgi:hypothetical protein